MALDLNDLNDLGNFFTNYDEQFQTAKVSKIATKLPKDDYTGKITKLEFDKTQKGKYLLKFEIEVLTAMTNFDQVGNLTSKEIWIDPASNKLNNEGQQKWVADIKQNLYQIGLIVDNQKLSELADPKKSILPTAIGNVVKFKTDYKTIEEQTYYNVYFQGFIAKAENNEQEVSKDDIPF